MYVTNFYHVHIYATQVYADRTPAARKKKPASEEAGFVILPSDHAGQSQISN